MKIFYLLAALVAATSLHLPGDSAQAADRICKAPVEGLAPLLDKPKLRYLLIGEIHGSVEVPAIFSDIACAASSRPLLIGVEWPADNQKALDDFLASRDETAARRLLSAAPALHRLDGRSSRAMTAMMLDIWRLRREGRDIAFWAFDYEIAAPGTSEERERRMAALLTKGARKHSEALVLALTGLGHADKTGFTSSKPPFASMVQHLPPDESISIAMLIPGGQIWACRRAVPDEPETCGAMNITARGAILPRGIAAGSPGFDASLSAGSTYTASPSGPDAHRAANAAPLPSHAIGAGARAIGVGAGAAAGAADGRAVRVSKCRCGASR